MENGPAANLNIDFGSENARGFSWPKRALLSRGLPWFFRENELEVQAFEEIAKISLAIEGEEANFSE